MGFGIGFGSTISSTTIGETTFYTVTVPIVSTYSSGTVFHVVIGGNGYDVTLTVNSTPSQVADLLTALGKGTWTVAAVGSNNIFTFVPTQKSDVLTFFSINIGGTTWYVASSGITDGLFSIRFIDSNTGWACGNNGKILKTTNGGSTWTAQSSGTTNFLSSIFFIDSNTGWACGGSGTILKTTNGGSTWVAQSSGTTSTLYSIFFIDSNTGFVCGYGGQIRYTSNGGSSWTFVNSTVSVDLYSIFFVSASTGFACGNNGTIIKTENGGGEWTNLTSGTTENLRSIFFINSNIGWCCGFGGTILKTTNEGSTWAAQSSGTSYHLRSIYFKNSNMGWSCGDFGTIVTTVSSTSYAVTSGATQANERSGKNINVTTGTQTITFTSPFSSSAWAFKGMPAVFDSNGDPVAYSISNKTANGFDITCTSAGSLSYCAFL